MTVVPFPVKTPPDDNVLLFTIDIYAGDRDGFSWVVRSEDEESQPDAEVLSAYLADMFIELNPEPPSILDRVFRVIRDALHRTTKDSSNDSQT